MGRSPAAIGGQRWTIWHAALVLPWVVAASGVRRTFNDNSYLWHVRAGDLQLDLGSVLTTDPFSFTMSGEPWRTQSWLADLVSSRLDDAFGLSGVGLITSSMATLMLVLLGLVAYKRSSSVFSVVLYLVATAVVTAAFLVPRPVIFSFPLFAAVVAADDDRRLRWALPLLMWLWASVHGSFVIGLAFLGLAAIARGLNRRRLIGLVAIGLPTLLTAHGTGVIDVLLSFSANQGALDTLGEWATPDLLTPPTIPVFLAILALVWLAHQGRLRMRDWWVMVPFLALALSANRSVPPAWIGLAPLLGRVTVPLRSTSIAKPVVVALVGTLVVIPFLLPAGEEIDRSRFPVAAATHLQTERVFHDDGVGGYLIYTQWPQREVYIDDRAELYGERLRRLLETRGGMSVWREEFDRWSIEEALLRKEEALVETLRSNHWTTAFEDEHFVVLRAPTS